MRFVVFLFIVFLCSSCSDDSYRSKIGELRIEKDKHFKGDPYSPIPSELKNDFKKLTYFNADETWNKMVEVEELEDKDTIEFTTSKEKKRLYLRVARIKFKQLNRQLSLMVYSSTDTGQYKHYFLPFKDQTNGKSTYGGGRYLDVQWPLKDFMMVDFNMSYNPYCAYNRNYSCPLVPSENQLDITIKAGEKLPDFVKH